MNKEKHLTKIEADSTAQRWNNCAAHLKRAILVRMLTVQKMHVVF